MARPTPKRVRPAAATPELRGELLRALAPTDEVLRDAVKLPALAALSRKYLKAMVQRVQDELRVEIAAGRHDLKPERAALLEAAVARVATAAAADAPALGPVVNATGVVLHTNLGRAILAESAIEALEEAARSPVNLEYDLAGGERGDRDTLIEDDLRALTGAEAATVVNNNAAAILLALNTLAEGREVIVSRGELIEIGGSFRMPDVMARSGVRLREVGTTNRTHPRDYADAIGADTALLLKVHPSNYRIVGFTSEVSLEELVAIGRERGVEVVEDLGAGALVDLSEYGLPREPVVAARIAAGAGLITFSGDKLLGGPQAGLIAGRRDLVERIRRNPLKRALRCDKLTLAALGATLRLYLRSGDLASDLPTLRLLRRTTGELKIVAERARAIIAERLGAEFQVEAIASSSEVGSGALPAEALASVAVRVTHPRKSASAIAAMFRRARIIGRITDRAFLLDMRTIEDPAVFAVELGPIEP
jgi:L-seryl-tRNA(Ser) seleniumtransferase